MKWKRNKNSLKPEGKYIQELPNNNTFSISYWFSKLKPPKRSTTPPPKPLLSPPHADIIPRRRSVSDDTKPCIRNGPRHVSLGSESELLYLNPIQTRCKKNKDPIKIRQKVRVRSPRVNMNIKGNLKGYERYAVVKKSRDLVRDFRESMVEMIWERGIGRPDELEKLLACYLSLNSDEHHDLIVKVFKQVWFDLKLGHN